MAVDREEQERELTAAEQGRLERYQQLSADLEAQGYKRTELTVGIVRANVIAMLAAIPIMVAGFALFMLANSRRELTRTFFDNGLVQIVAVLVLVVVHELVHGITWSFFTEHGFADIEFGFMKEYLTPYCVCTCPLTKTGHVVGTLAPLVLLGIIPTAIAIAMGSRGLLMLGLLMMLAAGGDVMIATMLLRHKETGTEYLVIDHPTQAGCAVFER